MTVGLLALFCTLLLIAGALGGSSTKGSCGNNPAVSLAAKSVGGEHIGVYEPCCKGHDDCYDRCQGKEACDDAFGSCLTTACAGSGVECANVAALFYTAVAKVPSVSAAAYEAACLAGGQKAGDASSESIPFASEPFLLSKGSHKLGEVTINVNQLGEWQITRNNADKAVRSQSTLSKMMEEGLISPEISAAVGNIARKHNISLRGEDLAIRIADSHGSQNMTASNLRLGVSSSVGQFELSLSDLHLAQHNSQGLRTFEEHKLLHLHFVAAGPKGEFFAQAVISAQNIANTFKEYGSGRLPEAAVVSMLDQVMDVSVAGCRTSAKCSKAFKEYRNAVNKAGVFVKSYNTIADVLKDEKSFDGFDKFATSTSLILSNVAQVTNNKDLRKIAVGVGLLTKMSEIGKAAKALSTLGTAGFSVAMGALTGALSLIATGLSAVTKLFGGGGSSSSGIGEAMQALAGMIQGIWTEMRESFNLVFSALDQINRNIAQMELSIRKQMEVQLQFVQKMYAHLKDLFDQQAQRSSGQYFDLKQSIKDAIHLIGIKDVKVTLTKISTTSETSITSENFIAWSAELFTWLSSTATSTASNGKLALLEERWVLKDADILNHVHQSVDSIIGRSATKQIPLGLFQSLGEQYDPEEFKKASHVIDIGSDDWFAIADVYCNLIRFGIKYIVASDESAQASFQANIQNVSDVAADSALLLERFVNSSLLWNGLIGRYQGYFNTIQAEIDHISRSAPVPEGFSDGFHWNILLSPAENFAHLDESKKQMTAFSLQSLRYVDDNMNACPNLGTLTSTDRNVLLQYRRAAVETVENDVRALYAHKHNLLFMVKPNCDEAPSHFPFLAVHTDRHLTLCLKAGGVCGHRYFYYTLHTERCDNTHATRTTCIGVKTPKTFTEGVGLRLLETDMDDHLRDTYLDPALRTFANSTSISSDSFPDSVRLSYASLMAFVLLLHPAAVIQRPSSSAAIDNMMTIRSALLKVPDHLLMKALNKTVTGTPFVNDRGDALRRLAWEEELWHYFGGNIGMLTDTMLQKRMQEELKNNPFHARLRDIHTKLQDLSAFVAESVSSHTRAKHDAVIEHALQSEQQTSQKLCGLLDALSGGVHDAMKIVALDAHQLVHISSHLGADHWLPRCQLNTTNIAVSGVQAAGPDPCGLHPSRLSCYLQHNDSISWSHFSGFLLEQTTHHKKSFVELFPLFACIGSRHAQCVRQLLVSDVVVTAADVAAAERCDVPYISSLAKYYFELQSLGLEAPPIKIGTILSILSNFSASLVNQQRNLENAVATFGFSGSGKSATTNALAGVHYVVVPEGDVTVDGITTFNKEDTLVLHPNSIPEKLTTSRNKSETIIPALIPMPYWQAVLIDLMGLLDGRGKEFDMSMAVMLQKLKSYISTVRVLQLLVTHDNLARRRRDSEVLPAFKMLGKIVNQDPELMNRTLVTINMASKHWNAGKYLNEITGLYANNKDDLDPATAYVLTHLTVQQIWPIPAPTPEVAEVFWSTHYNSSRSAVSFDKLNFKDLTEHTVRLDMLVAKIQGHMNEREQALVKHLDKVISAVNKTLNAMLPAAVDIPADFKLQYSSQLIKIAALQTENAGFRQFLRAALDSMTATHISERHVGASDGEAPLSTLIAGLQAAAVDAQVVKEVLQLFATEMDL